MTSRTLTALVGLLVLVCTQPALADPVFRGPEVYDGAWKTSNAWADPAAGPGDRSKGSFAFAYQAWAQERTDKYVEDRTLLDCADLSIALICEYAALNELPLSWRVYYPAERRFVTFDNEHKQFESPEAFREWSQWFLGAMNLADNTYPVTYDTWAGGDMVLMDWNQSDEWPNFGDDREVWHTYLIGTPDEVIYYGNEDDNAQPLAVTRVTGGSRMKMVRDHPDRYGLSPRRFRFFRGNVWAPVSEAAQVTRVRNHLNLRSGPGTGHARIAKGLLGERFEVLGREGQWVKLRLSDGREAWGHGYFLDVQRVTPAPATTESHGLSGALASGN